MTSSMGIRVFQPNNSAFPSKQKHHIFKYLSLNLIIKCLSSLPLNGNMMYVISEARTKCANLSAAT